MRWWAGHISVLSHRQDVMMEQLLSFVQDCSDIERKFRFEAAFVEQPVANPVFVPAS